MTDPLTTPTTRLAPSPTGALHLGNARTFLINWAIAKQQDHRIILRIEDLDTPRTKAGATDQAIDTLKWMGLDWHHRAPDQSSDLQPYKAAMSTLARAGLTYPSSHTRKDIEALSAPNEGDGELHAPPSLRPQTMPRDFSSSPNQQEQVQDQAWRFTPPPGPVEFEDQFMGPCAHDPSADVGDFLLWTKKGLPSYQLAVTVDDHRQGITHIVRGSDLAPSAARQILLRRALGYSPEPEWCHVPLIRGSDGRRLAKRHGDTRIDTYRDQGVRPQRIIALLARWSGIAGAKDLDAPAFAQAFSLATMPPTDPVFTDEDHQWLLSG